MGRSVVLFFLLWVGALGRWLGMGSWVVVVCSGGGGSFLVRILRNSC